MPDIKKQFDVVVMNPPYQSDSGNKGLGHTLWDQFVDMSITQMLKENGYLCAVHPAGWRRPTGSFVELGKKMRDRQFLFLSLHSIDEGLKLFGVTTRYDWYVMKNSENTSPTIVRGEDGVCETIRLANLQCVPNGKFSKIFEIIRGKDKIDILRSESAYECRRPWMSGDKGAKNKYPCIYSLPQKGIQLKWSSRNDKGHFGIPKIIFSNGAAPQILIDDKGEYGLTQWAFGIVDEPQNLPLIKKAMESKEFIEISKYMRFTLDRYDVNFISCLRKEFWKEFI